MLFLDTANIGELKKAKEIGIISGFTTNPTILESQKINEAQLLKHTNELFYEYSFLQLKGSSFEEMIDYFYMLKNEVSEPFSIKIPITFEGLKMIKYIKEKHTKIMILGTVVYTEAQGILAAMAGCDFVAPYYNRISQEGGDANQVIKGIRKYVNENSSSMKIMAASFKSTKQITEALQNGAHTCTIPYDLLLLLLTNKSANYDIEIFNRTEY